ncbi:HpcH/HpaI aldolase/citrate lyase family protein [Thioalkalicoccus limnaeus]|uniref:HpcH/HpaI aldolase/citrate lyase family protein n=1 Tax=Thioalkalicoccus limnaeus TaxID=120681 RepID=A0ABV4BEI6_9GAMM
MDGSLNELDSLPGAAPGEARGPEPLRYLALGATLYLPATRADLAAVLNREALPGLRSVIVCTEDAVHERDLAQALDNLRRVLPRLAPAAVRRFVRPRNPEVLARIMTFAGIERLDGLVLPKVDEASLPRYAEAAAGRPGLWLMPTLETEIVFSRTRLERLIDPLQGLANPILCLRIGGNDILHRLGLKRPKRVTLYETPLRTIVHDLIVTFRPAGFELAAPVFEHLDSPRVLRAEVRLDLLHGLWSKTAIHPTQVPTIEDEYRVPSADLDLAHGILAPDAPAVFQSHGQMVEPSTHSHWAERVLERAAIFGAV